MALKRNLRAGELYDRARASMRSARLTRVETVFLVLTVLFAFTVVYFYVAKVYPRKAELDGLEARERAAHLQLLDGAVKRKKLDAQRANSTRILDSLLDFERRLNDRSRGTPAIISEVNNLARQHRASAGDYSYRATAVETDNGESLPSSARRDESKLPVYSSLGIDTTVVGDYQDLRRLIGAIERSRQFILINAVAFQGEAEGPGRKHVVPAPVVLPAPGAPPVIQGSRPEAPAAVLVSLRIEMETYFRAADR